MVLKYENNNELIIYWTIGINKISFINNALKFSILLRSKSNPTTSLFSFDKQAAVTLPKCHKPRTQIFIFQIANHWTEDI